MLPVKKGTKKHCCYGICRSDTRSKSFSEYLYYFISFPKPCLEYRRKLIKSTKQKHIKNCPKCAKCNLWVKRCRRGDGRFQLIDHVNKDTYICSLHFEGESGPTTDHPDPIDCVKKESCNQVKVARTCLDEKYKQTHEGTNQDIEYLNHPAENVDSKEGLQNLIIDDEHNAATSPSALSHDVKTWEFVSCNEDNDISASIADEDYEVFTSTDSHLKNEISVYNITCSQGVQTDPKKFTSKRTQVKIRKNSAINNFEDSIKINKKKCKFYTSLEYQEIVILHNFVNPECKNVTDKDKPKKSNNSHQKLTSIQQLILVLIRLRMGILVEDLAYRFEISTGLVSKTVKTWIQFLYDQFTCNLKPFMFPSKKKIAETFPTTFKSMKDIRVIVDCMEFQCQSLPNFEHQGNLCSSYKARSIYKALIGCTPNGGVCFVSDVYEGSISDRDIFIKSNISDHLEPGDLVLADRGFTVHDIVESKQAYLNIPSFLNGRKPLSSQEETEMKQIAKQRIYVKHIIGRIKQFRLLQKVLPLSLRSLMSQILFVCACLVNFQSPIVID